VQETCTQRVPFVQAYREGPRASSALEIHQNLRDCKTDNPGWVDSTRSSEREKLSAIVSSGSKAQGSAGGVIVHRNESLGYGPLDLQRRCQEPKNVSLPSRL